MWCRVSGSAADEIAGRVRQAWLVERLRAAGLTQVAVWVPAGRTRDIQAAALRLRVAVGIPLPRDPIRGGGVAGARWGRRVSMTPDMTGGPARLSRAALRVGAVAGHPEGGIA